jgi:hypothetical protein
LRKHRRSAVAALKPSFVWHTAEEKIKKLDEHCCCATDAYIHCANNDAGDCHGMLGAFYPKQIICIMVAFPGTSLLKSCALQHKKKQEWLRHKRTEQEGHPSDTWRLSFLSFLAMKSRYDPLMNSLPHRKPCILLETDSYWRFLFRGHSWCRIVRV